MARTKAPSPPPTPERLREVLGSFRYAFQTERDLQDELARVLCQRGIRFDRNAPTPGGARADFLVDGTAVAVVLDGDPAERLGSLAAWSRASAVMLVTRRGPVPPSVPAKVGKKPLIVVTVGGA